MDPRRYGTVNDWMTRRPATVGEDCRIATALSHMESAHIRHLLVLDGERLSGIVSSRDVRRLLTEGQPPDRALTRSSGARPTQQQHRQTR